MSFFNLFVKWLLLLGDKLTGDKSLCRWTDLSAGLTTRGIQLAVAKPKWQVTRRLGAGGPVRHTTTTLPTIRRTSKQDLEVHPGWPTRVLVRRWPATSTPLSQILSPSLLP